MKFFSFRYQKIYLMLLVIKDSEIYTFFILLKASFYVAIIVEARYMRFFRNFRVVLLTCFEMCFTPT